MNRPTYFVSTEGQPRARRVADAVAAITGFVFIALGIYGVDRVSALEEAIQDLAQSQPSWLGSVMAIVFSFALIYGLVLITATVLGGRARRGTLGDVTLAVIVSILLGIVITLIICGEWPYAFPELGLEDPVPRFPIMRVAVLTAALAAASPHLGRPMRRLGWVTIVLTGVAAVALG